MLHESQNTISLPSSESGDRQTSQMTFSSYSIPSPSSDFMIAWILSHVRTYKDSKRVSQFSKVTEIKKNKDRQKAKADADQNIHKQILLPVISLVMYVLQKVRGRCPIYETAYNINNDSVNKIIVHNRYWSFGAYNIHDPTTASIKLSRNKSWFYWIEGIQTLFNKM